MFGRKHGDKGENTAKEPLDVACVLDTTPQRRWLSNIVDADLVSRFGISLHISSTEPGGEDARRGLSSFRCIASTGKMVAVAIPEVGDHNSVARMVDGEAAQLVVRVHSKFICQ